MTRAGVFAALAFTICLAAGPVRAEPREQERVLANALFDEARKLMAEGRFDEACPKFAESQRLQPGGGTLLNLGVCHEKQGKTATAWGELKAALAMARRDGRADREALALERIAAIEPTLSYLTLRVRDEARVPGLVVKLDGVTVAAPSWGTAQPVDPGAHEVEGAAPGRETFTLKLSVAPTGQRALVEIPELRALEIAPGAESRIELSGHHVASIVSGSIGVVGIAFGIGFGVAASDQWSSSDAACPTPTTCTPTGAEAALDAGRQADVATVAFVVGGAGLGLGAILWAIGPSVVVPRREADRSAVSIGLAADPRSFGLSVRGATW